MLAVRADAATASLIRAMSGWCRLRQSSQGVVGVTVTNTGELVARRSRRSCDLAQVVGCR